MEICYITMMITCIPQLLILNNVLMIHIKVILHLVTRIRMVRHQLQIKNIKFKETDSLHKNLSSQLPLANLIKILIFLVPKLDLKLFKSLLLLKKILKKDNQILMPVPMFQVMMRQQILSRQLFLRRAHDQKRIGKVMFFLGLKLILVIEKFQQKERELMVIIMVMILIQENGNLKCRWLVLYQNHQNL